MKFAKTPRRYFNRGLKSARKTLATRSPRWLQHALGPLARQIDLMIIDHGVFRLFYANAHALSPEAHRSSQPAPHDIRRFARAGVRTIVNLRGKHPTGAYWLEEHCCREAGIELVDFELKSRAAPKPEAILAARDLFDSIAYPVLMHCKSGADRVGLMSVLYQIFRQGKSVEEAMLQLHWRYGHIRAADTGVLDHFFESYLAANRASPIGFLQWVETAYDPKAVEESFQAGSFANVVVNRILRRE
jgi:protein tyrosine/serine phosphatase